MIENKNLHEVDAFNQNDLPLLKLYWGSNMIYII